MQLLQNGTKRRDFQTQTNIIGTTATAHSPENTTYEADKHPDDSNDTIGPTLPSGYRYHR